MHLLLIRHGETEHNIAGLLVGVTDSRLTNHGFLQAERLGKALATKRGLRFTHIFASTLQRAWITAGEIQKHQAIQFKGGKPAPQVVQTPLLLEQDFGSYELLSWSLKRAKDALDPTIPDPDEPDFKPKETHASMQARAQKFVDDFLLPLILSEQDPEEDVVAVVAHGLFLQQLWRNIFVRFVAGNVSVGTEAELPIPGQSIGDVRKWGNTGYLECTIRPQTLTLSEANITDSTIDGEVEKLSGRDLKVLAINKGDHIVDLKRNGVGSSPYDFRQQSIKGFFKRKTDEVVDIESSSKKPKE